MSKDLIIVESPAKVKTIKKFLGRNYEVAASVGHVRDLPTSKLGVDEESFVPEYEVIQGKQSVVTKLKSAAKSAGQVYLAPDPDREGEAIAWHVAELIKKANPNVKRIQFNEITASAVREALEHPRELDENLFNSQQVRRILDRLVGYKLSPLLWKKIKRGISAGRVQSVALRMIVEREKERRAFNPEEYWVFKADLAPEGLSNAKQKEATFPADLNKVKGKKPNPGKNAIANQEMAEALEKAVLEGTFTVASVEEKERSRSPLPPFITSTLQQAANHRLNYSAKRTMSVAQRLYEGVDVGKELGGTRALITYMRTDSVRVAKEAMDAAKEYILDAHGKDYYPPKPRFFKGKASAQDAHEAIRPVDVSLTPMMLQSALPKDQLSLYKLIWERFVASQMAAARFWDTTVLVANGETEWRSKGERLLFPGFMAVMAEKRKDTPELPKLTQGDVLDLVSLAKEQKFTQPPPRFSEASLVRELEEKGIGRPSTYAAIISTLIDRDYAQLNEKHFVPSDLGEVVSNQLSSHFQELMDVTFTAQMEEQLDKVALGEADWVELLKQFTTDFYPTLEAASKAMETVKTGIDSGLICEECGKPMVIKFGKAGTFLACSGYPDCKNTKNFSRDENGEIVIAQEERPEFQKVGECPECKGDLVLKRARTGSRFIACNNYPKCKYSEPFTTGVKCPREGCDGELVERSSKRGKIFYSCNRYPKCDYALWDWPVEEPCPKCDSPLLVRKTTKGRGEHIACPAKTCRYVRAIEREDDENGSDEETGS